VSINYGWQMTRFQEFPDRVEAQIESGGQTRKTKSAYLIGADGPRSSVRQALASSTPARPP